MATSAQIGAGTLVQSGSGASPQVWTTIPEVQTIPPVGETKEEIEVTHLNSTAKEYIGGLPDGSSLELAVNYVPGDATHEALIADWVADESRDFRIVFLGGDILQFQARVLTYEYSGGPNDKITLTFTLKITGSITHS